MYENYRYPGEFEKQEAVMINWVADQWSAKGYDAHKTFVSVIKNLVDEVQVYVNCGVEGTISECKEKLETAGVNLDKIIFTQFEDTLNWARDYGPDIMVDDKGHKVAVNQNFNTYGQESPEHKEALNARKTGIHQSVAMGCYDFINSEIISEGGDKEFNGAGVLITIEDTEVHKRNPQYTKEEVEAEYKKIFNLKRVIWLPKPTYEDEEIYDGPLDVVDGKAVYRSLSANGHIDEMCRFIGKNKILLAEVTDKEAEKLESMRITKERLDAAYEILKNETDAEGNVFEIIRMPVPEPMELTVTKEDYIYQLWSTYKDIEGIGDTLRDGSHYPYGDELNLVAAASYCNFLICNDVVLGQGYFKEGMDPKIKEKDENVKSILEKVFPNRKVIMIDALAVNILGGGVHCITKNVAAAKSE
ncbi:MAG: agmatine deiminase family protein [Clostridiaceae bacterium]|nr:agmatine deiminase family protein [Clostridiaceae bacterium]